MLGSASFLPCFYFAPDIVSPLDPGAPLHHNNGHASDSPLLSLTDPTDIAMSSLTPVYPELCRLQPPVQVLYQGQTPDQIIRPMQSAENLLPARCVRSSRKQMCRS
ncbi:hypothetical protein SNK03_005010 [Fusarium graminearum]|uniref:Chromosome 2, complete genome n=1 Tax=Gibberella zeae (strain ATCC MYA-4620 / CBS 123657 / FGSC 9075 / NRRL 31084 / PH-1) TaxID=229533 RepID=I1S8Y6_GIBZE|nr:hypothetical protein FGSG_13315 [Fusarium graminearum PH-1]ESU14613.1 hypothetical protein FGSG_13315 [Fusarium graminearum PH-1]CEF77101.1 unnamed protein product [Fusarium graminearum]CZS80392.1 unnamed protein product [Fusarium graminearum]|eukprot:XP_011320038.1 hypothetical protein FGSG_13315 [Fusarium graminearum PH-1]